MSLVVMRPDGGADLALDLRAELRAGWTGPATWGLLAVGVLLVVCAVLLLLRPLRPREVIFVVEPDQVPVLAGRLGVTSLSGLGPREPELDPAVAGRQLTPVGSGPGDRLRLGDRRRPARPATLADLDEPVRLPAPTGGDAESRLAAGRRGGPRPGRWRSRRCDGPARWPVGVTRRWHRRWWRPRGDGEWPSALPTRRATLTGGSVLPERRLR